MADLTWANTDELRSLVARAEVRNATAFTLSSEAGTRAFLAEIDRVERVRQEAMPPARVEQDAGHHSIYLELKFSIYTTRLVSFDSGNFTMDAVKDSFKDSWQECAVSDFDMYVVGKKTDRIHYGNFAQLVTDGCLITAKLLSVGFSEMKATNVLNYAGLRKLYQVQDSEFGDFETQSDVDVVGPQVDIVYHELCRRSSVFGVSLETECTVREFISPILIASCLLVGGVQMYCEKNIRGSKANGPIDYVVIYNAFAVCVTEAKRLHMEDGTIQNIAQLKACREAFQQQLAVTDNKERKRYREYDEADYNYNIPSCGIVTCGDKWRLLKYMHVPSTASSSLSPSSTSTADVGGYWVSVASDIISFALEDILKNEASIKAKIRVLLLKIGGMLQRQMEKCDSCPDTKKFSPRDTLYY